MYTTRPNLTIGFHGCDLSVRETLLNDTSYFKPSQEAFDWLGHGMYFWENNPSRAVQWAYQKKRASKINDPSVIGAILDLGYCLDLLDSGSIELLRLMFNIFEKECRQLGQPVPENINHPRVKDDDKTLRFLDCAVIQFMHKYLSENNEKPFDSIRATFTEGLPIYPRSSFHEKTHIQICIINPNCIKGYFLPRQKVKNHPIV